MGFSPLSFVFPPAYSFLGLQEGGCRKGKKVLFPSDLGQKGEAPWEGEAFFEKKEELFPCHLKRLE